MILPLTTQDFEASPGHFFYFKLDTENELSNLPVYICRLRWRNDWGFPIDAFRKTSINFYTNVYGITKEESLIIYDKCFEMNMVFNSSGRVSSIVHSNRGNAWPLVNLLDEYKTKLLGRKPNGTISPHRR